MPGGTPEPSDSHRRRFTGEPSRASGAREGAPNTYTLTKAEVQAQWGPHLTQTQLDRLSAVLGKRGEFNMTPAQAQNFVRELRDIEISWDAAQAVYSGFTVPSRGRMVLRYLANARELHPHSFGSLVSLVFNRGTSFYSDGDRYKEMREIRGHMSARAFGKIPDAFRRMKRIWEGTGQSGLLKRRDGEAVLFQAGMDAPSASVAVAGMPAPTRPVVTLEARILQVREVKPAERVGYGATETVGRPSRIAVVGVGYADGYHRRAGSSDARGGARAYLRGRYAPLVGRISMDLLAVDVTAIPGAERGDWVELFGPNVAVDEVARHAETIGYELLTGLGRRYARSYVGP